MLVPTPAEARAFEPAVAVEVCGFGLAAAGVGAMAAIARHRPARLILAGIAGSYDAAQAPVGSAVVAGRVRCVGIGAGGSTAAELGFAESDQLELDGGSALALSVASASASAAQAEQRLLAYPEAVLEEMEGYAVALAAMTAGIPCVMVRGISNLAGHRDRGDWDVDAALDAARRRLDTILAG